MHFSTVLLALNFGSAALALPALFKRQDPITVESIVVETNTAVITPDATTSDSPFPEASATGSADIDYSAYPCPEGYLLTYQENQRTYDVSYTVLRDAGLMSGSFSYAPQFNPAEGTDYDGSGVDEVGTTRTNNSPLVDSVFEETLVATDTSSEAYSAASNLTEPLTIGDLTIATWSYVYQVYSNASATDENRSTIKMFANACASDQPAARLAMEQLFTAAFDNIGLRVDNEQAAFTATQTFVATIAPPVVTDTAFATRTEQNTRVTISTDTLIEQNTETATATSILTEQNTATQTLVNEATVTATETVQNTETDTSVIINQQTETEQNTDTATQTLVLTETDVQQNTETQVVQNTQTDTAVVINTETEQNTVQNTVTATETATQTPDIAQVTSQIVVPSVVPVTNA